jgi:hypothetical protein
MCGREYAGWMQCCFGGCVSGLSVIGSGIALRLFGGLNPSDSSPARSCFAGPGPPPLRCGGNRGYRDIKQVWNAFIH